MNQKQIKYFLYARKSSEAEDRQAASIDAQIKELKKITKEKNLKIVKIFSEAKSAKAPGRPEFIKMIEGLKNGEANGILCWKLNRLARNSIDGGEISWLLQQKVIEHIQTQSRDYKPEDNVLMMSVEFGMANQFVKDLSDDTKRGLRAKAEKGWFPGQVPLGYMHDPKKVKGDTEILVDEPNFVLMRKAFDLVLEGTYTAPKVLEIANDKWGMRSCRGTKIADSTFYRMLTNTFYYGEFEYPLGSGNWYHGKHKPLITSDEFDKIQIILGREGKPRPKKHRFAYTGVIRCGECGCMITAEHKIKRQKNGNVHHYIYYRCTKRKRGVKCKQKTIKKKFLEEQMLEQLDKITIREEFKDWALGVLKKQNEEEADKRNVQIKDLQNKYNKSVQKIDQLIDMLASQLISEDDFKRKKKQATKEKDDLQKLLDDANSNVNEWIDKAEQMFEFATHAKESFANGNYDKKRSILNVLGSNFVLFNQKLNIELDKSMVLCEKISKEVNAFHVTLEPLKKPINKQKLGALYSQSRVVGG